MKRLYPLLLALLASCGMPEYVGAAPAQQPLPAFFQFSASAQARYSWPTRSRAPEPEVRRRISAVASGLQPAHSIIAGVPSWSVNGYFANEREGTPRAS